MTNDRSLADALKCLPHGTGFRFLDRLTALNPGKSGEGEYLIRGDEPFLKGHFPGNPIFPGVLLLEAAAQLAGVVAQTDPVEPHLPGLKLTALRTAKILGTGRPGERLQLYAEITGRLANLVQARCSAHINRQPVLQADVVLSGTGESPAPSGAP
ncbi:MAG: beta-hydroxyacyl-ACP dehydratase [Verrucomicrobia bacterium]|jgi:3-hydroxyacyl-[acyl-carrier-protein] dehydratase|nr:beta-hydroxyacyl-ACP dehydratase [Verrucomicrobiota bacterium]